MVVAALGCSLAFLYGTCSPPRLSVSGDELTDEGWRARPGDSTEVVIGIYTDIPELSTVDSIAIEPEGVVAVNVQLGEEGNYHPATLEALGPGRATITVTASTTSFDPGPRTTELEVVVE